MGGGDREGVTEREGVAGRGWRGGGAAEWRMGGVGGERNFG